MDVSSAAHLKARFMAQDRYKQVNAFRMALSAVVNIPVHNLANWYFGVNTIEPSRNGKFYFICTFL